MMQLNPDGIAAEIARRDLLCYCRRVDDKYQTPKHIEYIAGLLDKVERGETLKLGLVAPPRFGKSRIVTRFASWWLHKEPNRHLLLVSASQTLSIRNSKWIRADVQSPEYPWPVTISEDTSSVLNWSTSAGSSVRALSIGTTITGLQADFAILDDVQADEMTPQTRDALEDFLRGTLETRLEPGAPVILINSRHGTDDIFARLVENGEDADAWTSENLEAICETLPDAIGRDIGESLWPQKWPVHLLEAKKLSVGQRVWESQYQGSPLPEHGRLIDVSLFKDYDVLPVAPQPQWDPIMHIYDSPLNAARPVTEGRFLTIVGIDTSGVTTTTTSGSWSAWVTCMMDCTTGDIFVTDMQRCRNVSFEELRRRVVAHLAKCNPDLVVVENASQGGRLAESIRGMTRCPVQLVEARASKEERVIAVLPLLEGGRMHIPARAAWRTDFLKELANFPAGKNSDITDAWAYAVNYCRMALARRRGDALFDAQVRALEAGGFMAR